MSFDQPAASFGTEGLQFPSFKKPIPRDDVLSAGAPSMSMYGDTNRATE